ncbi:MAG TPA: proteasome activator [Actinomycetota bacterium]|jgi:hypothetical protein|nr:proteasome activator [Actinomycetota bacterium]
MEPRPAQDLGNTVDHPAKLLRIASMVRELQEEIRRETLDEAGVDKLRDAQHRILDELQDVLSEGLREELSALAAPAGAGATESELRVVQAQLLGWLEGLFQGIQAAVFTQQMQARAQLEQMRGRNAPAPSGGPQPPAGGQYL